MTEATFDTMWRCPLGHSVIGAGAGDGRRRGGSAVVTAAEPPKCYCGREMEQATSILLPDDDRESDGR